MKHYRQIRSCAILAFLIFIRAASIYSQESDSTEKKEENISILSSEKKRQPARLNTGIYLFPFADYPFNFRPGSLETNNNSPVPSMDQSLYLSKNIVQLAHAGIDSIDYQVTKRPKTSVPGVIAMIFADITFSFYFEAWLHEEWHRAVMGRRNIESYNGLYKYTSGNTIPVTNVEDRDLIRLKKEHPDELVRLAAAGMEAENEMSFQMQKDSFVNNTPIIRDTAMILLNTFGNIYYLQLCDSKDANKETVLMNLREGSGENVRDFIGLDCNAYVYDLFRPDVPYEERGRHPFGPGIDRYIKYSDGYDPETAFYNLMMYGTTMRKADLTESERKYLHKQYRLSYINLLTPSTLGMGKLVSKNPFTDQKIVWNFGFAHYLAPFGYSLQGRLFYKYRDYNFILILHTYHNAVKTTAGLEAELHRKPAVFAGKNIFIGGGLHVWQQPGGLLFWEDKSIWGGMVKLNAAFPVNSYFEYTLELSGKTPGWAAGTVYHNREAEIRAGVNLII